MATIIRNRTIHPSTRLEKSKSYKIDTENIGDGDVLRININHESNPLKRSYLFDGKDVCNRKSISFRVNDYGTHIDISWSGANPQDSISQPKTKVPIRTRFTGPLIPIANKMIHGVQIKGLPSIEDPECQLLILGTMPGVESLKQQAYYGNHRNLFWKLTAIVTGETTPESYEEKKKYLLRHRIALWDICQVCVRPGSLDSSISDEVPNDINAFITRHPHLKAIGCNGKESARMFKKYIVGIENVKFISLPSSSPANAGIPWEKKVEEWSRLKEYI
jgi:hypoxanthine-DNA glycosylase